MGYRKWNAGNYVGWCSDWLHLKVKTKMEQGQNWMKNLPLLLYTKEKEVDFNWEISWLILIDFLCLICNSNECMPINIEFDWFPILHMQIMLKFLSLLSIILILSWCTGQCIKCKIQVLKPWIHYCGNSGSTLLGFRARVETDPYGAFANWNDNDNNPCMWFGVHCVDGEVQML